MKLKLDASYLKPKVVKIRPTGEGLNAEQWTSEILQSNMNALFLHTIQTHMHTPTLTPTPTRTSTNTECYTTNQC